MTYKKMYKMMQLKSKKNGFSLMELIVYVAVSSLVLVTAVNIGVNLLLADANSFAKREVYYNARLVANQIQYQVRGADDVIVSSSVFGMNPGVLTLDYPGEGTDVIIDTYSKDVTVGGQVTTITKLRIKEGEAGYVDLTSDSVSVTNFTIINMTRGTESKNIKIGLEIKRANPGNDPKYDASISMETALSIRK
jgi:hypothetical protein